MSIAAGEKVKEKNVDKTKTESVDLDTILQEEVGQFGCFQVRNIILALIAVVFMGWTNKAYVFTTARISSRCYISECDFEESEFTPAWLLKAVPGSSLTSFERCQRYASFGNASTLTEGEDICPDLLFNREKLQNCEQSVYQNTDTVVYDFNLGCDEWRRSMIGSIRLSATIFAHPITGFVSDRWGRRTSLVFNSFNAGWIGIVRSYSTSYTYFVITEFVHSMFASGTLQAANILMMELVSPERRVFAGACLYTSLSVGYVTLGLIAWAVPNWRQLIRALCIPQLVTIAYIWLMAESVRWYISKGRYEDTKNALNTIARVNNTEVSERSLELLKTNSEEKKKQDTLQENEQNKAEPWLMKLIFRHKTMVLRCFVTPFWWISFTVIYHGIAINAVNISGNKYFNFMAVAAAQIPGYWIAYLLLDRAGRKPVLVAAFWICAACEIGFIFIPKDQYTLSLLVYMLGAACSGSMLSALYVYSAELYPTPSRHRLFAFSSSVGRLGAIVAPLTPALSALMWEHLPFALFAGCACVAGALVLLTPETRGERLPDTMQEAADLGRKKQSNVI